MEHKKIGSPVVGVAVVDLMSSEVHSNNNEAVVIPSFRGTKLGFQIGCFCKTLLPENYTIIALGKLEAKAITFTAGRLYFISKLICCGDICT
jgi:hypothetical protein